MTESTAELDFGDFEIKAVQRLREPKVQPVPAAIVKLAQMAVDGMSDQASPGHVLHTLERRFPTADVATAAVRHFRNAGLHVTPVSSITAVQDPEGVALGREVDPCTVRWQAGSRRGAKPKDADETPKVDETPKTG